MKNREEHNNKTIPVFVDSVKKNDQFKMTRLIFFSISYDRDRINWIYTLIRKGIPFIQVGIHCIVYKPLGEEKKFTSTKGIRELFSKIRGESFLIDTGHIFIPNHYFKILPMRGEVYRLELHVFLKGFQLANDLIYVDDFDRFFKEQNLKISRDELETKIFESWGQEKNDELKKRHGDLLKKSEAEYHKHYLAWKPESEMKRR